MLNEIMKILITENKLETVFKKSGVEKTVKMLGGWANFRNIFNIKSYVDYLHLFDDLEEVQSTENPKFQLYRHTPGKNIIIYNTTENRVGISDNEIISIIEGDLLGYSPMVKNTREIIQTWLNEVYNIDVAINKIHLFHSWDDVSRIE